MSIEYEITIRPTGSRIFRWCGNYTRVINEHRVLNDELALDRYSWSRDRLERKLRRLVEKERRREALQREVERIRL